MDQELISAAEHHFQELLEAEKRVLLAESGNLAICGPDANDSNPANDPENGEHWGEERTIRASVIEWLCRNAEAFGRTASNGINVYGAKVVDDLGLSYRLFHK